MKHFLRMGSALFCLASMTAQAAPVCTPTPGAPTLHYPGSSVIPTSNNLLQPEGKSVAVEGQKLVVTGYLYDKKCHPIPEATVELWQADPFGKWYLAEGEDLVSPGPVFAGAGRTHTDVYGRFTFITAFPGAVVYHPHKNQNAIHAPQLNLRIKAEGFPVFNTALFFGNDKRNGLDDSYKKLAAPVVNGTTLTMDKGSNGDLNGSISLVLDGIAPYQTY